MTRKDYVFIADIIREFKGNICNEDQFISTINNLCESLKEDNPRFDTDKFIKYILND